MNVKSDEQLDKPELIVAIAGIKERKVVLIKSKKHFGKWVLPAGHVELGESLKKAAKREFEEETGGQVKNLQFVCIHEAIFPKGFVRKAHFVIVLFKGEVVGDLAQKSSEASKVKLWPLKKAISSLQVEPHSRQMLESLNKL